MKFDELLGNLLKDGITPSDIATTVNDLRMAHTSVVSERDKALEEKKMALEESTKYAKLNNELYLQLGTINKDLSTSSMQDNPSETPPKKRSFEELEL